MSTDFSDIATGEKLQPIHPGETLREEFPVPPKMTPHALRLARYFGTRAEFWMGLQTGYDMAISRASLGDTLNRIQHFEPAQV